MSPQTPASLPGEGYLLGKYEVLRRLATGGMAEIFLARVLGIPGVEKIVVLKRMLPQLANQEEFVTMFLDEARIAAALHHPNIVHTYDVGVVDHQHFIAMEYCHGEDLRAIMKAVRAQKRALPLEHGVQIIARVCAALQHAHDLIGIDGRPLDIVHRDVSPQNVIVTYDGGVKLLDFGIAKSSSRYSETRYGTLKGKIGYMSPEQCRGEPIDRRSDVFAAGILLYELTTGRRLYRGTSEFEVLKRIVEGAVPSPRRLDPTYPAALDAIVVRALAKDPNERYQSATALEEALEGYGLDLGLALTPDALAAFMEDAFARKAAAWRDAEREGKDLVRHLLEQTGDEIAAADGDPVELPPEDRDAEDGLPLWDAMPPPASATASPEPPAADGASAPPIAAAAAHARPASLPASPVARPWLVAGLTGAVTAAVITLAAIVVVPRLRPSSVAAPIAAPIAALVVAPAPPASAPAASPAATLVAAVAAPLLAAPSPTPAEALGLLQVITRPPGATLFIDGRRDEHVSPATLDRLAVGKEHLLLAQLGGYEDEVRQVTIPPAGLLKLELSLRPVAKPPARRLPPRGKLHGKRRRR